MAKRKLTSDPNRSKELLGEVWQPAKSPADAFGKLKQSSPNLEVGNRLFERVKKKLGSK